MLKINMEYRKGILFVRLKGTITRYTYKSLNEYMIPVIKNQGLKYIVYNLSGVTIIDNFGKIAIQEGINTARKNGGDGLICNTNLFFHSNYKVIESELNALEFINV